MRCPSRLVTSFVASVEMHRWVTSGGFGGDSTLQFHFKSEIIMPMTHPHRHPSAGDYQWRQGRKRHRNLPYESRTCDRPAIAPTNVWTRQYHFMRSNQKKSTRRDLCRMMWLRLKTKLKRYANIKRKRERRETYQQAFANRRQSQPRAGCVA